MGSLGARLAVYTSCNPSPPKYPHEESKTRGMILKGEFALPKCCTSYQGCIQQHWSISVQWHCTE